MLDDLIESLGQSAEPISETRPYFLGSIVLVKGERPESQIVDGQQRLVTLTILLAVFARARSEQYRDITLASMRQPIR